MMRIAGFVTGVLLVVAGVLGLGSGRIPDPGGIAGSWKRQAPDVATATAPPGAMTGGAVPGMETKGPIPVGPGDDRPPAVRGDPVTDPGEVTTGAPVGQLADLTIAGDDGDPAVPLPIATAPDPETGAQAESAAGVAPDPLPADRWEAFFTPFRSEASARGFANFLRTATGREFEVRRAGPGNYRVWFSMEPGESRPERMAEIETVTGMILSGGRL